jgi:type II secretory pathway pseudopilin PulG
MLLSPPPSHLTRSSPTARRARLGFSLTELLVVIGIIVLLVGILLVALGQVQAKARRTQTESTMQQFLNACTAFQAENDRYPGVIPESVLVDPVNYVGTPAVPKISSTENALLDLLGGFRVLAPTDDTTPDSAAEVVYNDYLADAVTTSSDLEITWNVPGGGVWKLAIDTRRIGEGPIINGKPRAPYFTPASNELVKLTNPANEIPDLVDAWGQPLLYLRQARERGPLLPDGSPTQSQFAAAGLWPYVKSDSLGDLQQNQTTSGGNQRASILNTAPDGNATLAKFIAHPAIANQAKGGICLISAGPDGVYFSRVDGPGSQGTPIDDIVTNSNNEYNNPKVVDDYDDVRVFGGA